MEKCSNCGAKVRSRARYCHRCCKPLGLSQDNASEESAKLSEALKNNETTKLDTGEIEAEVAKLKRITLKELQDDEISSANLHEEKSLEEVSHEKREVGQHETGEVLNEDRTLATEEGNEEEFQAEEERIQAKSERILKDEFERGDVSSFEKPIRKPEAPLEVFLGRNEDYDRPIKKPTAPLEFVNDELTSEAFAPAGVADSKDELDDITEDATQQTLVAKKLVSEDSAVGIVPESRGVFLYLATALVLSLVSLLLLLMMIWLK